MKTKPSKANLFKLLYRQKVIENSICANCPFLNSQNTNDCRGCESYEELNNIGLWMLKETANRKGRGLEVIRRGIPTDEATMTMDLLTVEVFNEWKSLALSDKAIAEKLNVTYSSFKEWKESMGLVRRKGARV